MTNTAAASKPHALLVHEGHVADAYDAQEMARSTDDVVEKVGHLGEAMTAYTAAARTALSPADRRRHLGNVRMLVDGVERLTSRGF